MIWKPNVTVAAVVEQNGKYLLVEEIPKGTEIKLNQPAGHLEPGESIIQACCREVLEETGHTFQPEVLTGIYHWTSASNGITYLRFTFSGQVTAFDHERKLDTGIIRAIWLNIDEIRAKQAFHRTPLVMQCIEDYLTGRNYPLNILKYYG
ncbi:MULTISPECIES: NUDIX hydrolase [Nitrosomonas]|uniref:Phosphatase NudJ n=2 Tax=Nitrosomonas eutropha TaxID=916 RepID=A0ABX5MDG3_9PROT|nr:MULTISPECIES: NUDIX hydrolase [Nitrosomonas]ABI58543.1 NUDIX hydrolase [Nitrosomonas eutropha C91]MXS80965.1 NUDIX hydrolase [Nitrosomonas sp. GH22]PXV82338.1 ADP-ribose pyrophosphatase YjhB (NUDIX family) [Nitrosomonas eutropha]SCX13392.1 ADP-ribose pyrophosphatase YjhB, NUDIX family [Nitrosomonas eutropha]SDW14807.1 ADP-ribose pyrophosphatase YjhB, NUDIX family [Nitrosomonas eutropha]